MVQTKQRIKFIDAMRGVTMILVVYAHVLQTTIGNHNVFAGQLFATFRMPMFFFISGFVAFKAIDRWSTDFFRQMMGKKFIVQIIPASIFFCLYNFVFSSNPLDVFLADGFVRYWFTYALFGMFLLYFTISWISHLCKSEKMQEIGLIIVSILALCALSQIVNNDICKKFAIARVCQYFPFFTLGLLTRKHFDYVKKLLDGSLVISLALITFVAALYFCYQPMCVSFVPHNLWWLLRILVVSTSGLVVVFTFFYRNSSFFDQDNCINKSLMFIGRRTLDIYLIHAFLLPDMTFLSSFFSTNCVFLLELFLGLVIALMIVSVCLLISAVIRMSPILGHYLLGAQN